MVHAGGAGLVALDAQDAEGGEVALEGGASLLEGFVGQRFGGVSVQEVVPFGLWDDVDVGRGERFVGARELGQDELTDGPEDPRFGGQQAAIEQGGAAVGVAGQEQVEEVRGGDVVAVPVDEPVGGDAQGLAASRLAGLGQDVVAVLQPVGAVCPYAHDRRRMFKGHPN